MTTHEKLQVILENDPEAAESIVDLISAIHARLMAVKAAQDQTSAGRVLLSAAERLR
jgi:hypothetical protein